MRRTGARSYPGLMRKRSLLILQVALAAHPVPALAGTAHLAEERNWMLSINLGGGGTEDHDPLLSAYYLAYRAVRPHLVVGGRAGMFIEPGIDFGPDRDAALFDLGPLVGLSRGFGRVATVASAGPVLTVAKRHSDIGEEPADAVVTAGLALDAIASVRLGGSVGVGLHTGANLNSELVAIAAGLSLNVTFGR
jgi:hypothetical protein